MKRTMNEITTDIMVHQMQADFALDPEDLNLQIKELFDELYKKEDGIYWFYQDNEKKIEMINEHIDKCKIIKDSIKNGNERMKYLIIDSHAQTNTLPKHSIFNPIKIRKSAGAVEVLNENDIPAQYYKEVTVVKLDKKRILAELKEGKRIPGVRLIKKDFVGGLK